MVARPKSCLARLAAGAAALFICGLSPGFAGEVGTPVAVVELFTSEGCSSCPPADEVLAELADDPRLIALSYHVDYWDYLGWKDRLATPANTERQKRYARAFGTSVYTPEAVINGRTGVIGSHRDAIDEAIEAVQAKGSGLTVPVSIKRVDDKIIVDVGAASGIQTVSSREAEVVLASIISKSEERIRGGENKGAVIRYVNAVTQFQPIGIWEGGARRFEMPANTLKVEDGPIAVLVQRSDSGAPAILGAALLK